MIHHFLQVRQVRGRRVLDQHLRLGLGHLLDQRQVTADLAGDHHRCGARREQLVPVVHIGHTEPLGRGPVPFLVRGRTVRVRRDEFDVRQVTQQPGIRFGTLVRERQDGDLHAAPFTGNSTARPVHADSAAAWVIRTAASASRAPRRGSGPPVKAWANSRISVMKIDSPA